MLEKTGFIDHQHGVVVSQMLHEVFTNNVTQRVRIPTIPSQQSLLAPWARVTGSLGAHPTGLTAFVAEQVVKEQPGVHRRAMLGK